MKKTKILLLTFILVFNLVAVVNASSEIIVKIDGEVQKYDQPPIMVNGTTLVPMRGIFEALGAEIEWNDPEQTITATKDDTIIVITLNKDYAKVNGEKVNLTEKAQLVNGRTMVPLRFVSEALGAEVKWDNSTNTIVINSQSGSAAKTNDGGKLSTEKVVELNEQKVVLVETELGTGSGVVIKDGLVLTNYHVISDVTTAKIKTSDGNEYKVEGIVTFDPNTDLAVLKTVNKINVEPVKIGSTEGLKKGEAVVAIGSPEGLQNTVSDGLISGFREYDNINYIQISAPITYGSSGGALFNLKGELIGITSFGYEYGNLNFAVPIDQIADWMNGILAKDFNDFSASFLGEKTSYGEYSLSQLEKLLNDSYYLTIDLEGHVFEIDHYIVTKENGKVYIDGFMYGSQYYAYNLHYDKFKEDLDTWQQNIAQVLYTIYPEQDIIFTIYYRELTYKDPTGFFAAEDIYYDEEADYWDIQRWIIGIDIPAKANEFYTNSRP